MNLSSVPSGPAGFISEPPLSPGSAPAPPLSIAPSLEAQVVRMGLMTPADVETTMQEEAETGRTFAELAVEQGRVEADDLARLTAPDVAEPETPEPEANEPQAAEAETPPAPPAAEAEASVDAEVFLRLTSGERITAGKYEGQSVAEQRAKDLMQALDAHGDWPCIDGRYIRPDAVVSIDVDLATL